MSARTATTAVSNNPSNAANYYGAKLSTLDDAITTAAADLATQITALGGGTPDVGAIATAVGDIRTALLAAQTTANS